MLTLLTDFGTQDVYVGVMKGVIAHINPQGNVVDLTHAIPPQDIAAARFSLMNAFPYFPPGTVHVVVVDPGVGTARRAIAIRCGTQGYLVAPDNGIVSGVVAHFDASKLFAVELTNHQYWRTPNPSTTFHGRDIFAPVGAHLASGVPIEDLGTPIAPESLIHLPIPSVQPSDVGIVGTIQYIDIFGNLITTISGDSVSSRRWSLRCGLIEIPSGQTYGDVEFGRAIALVGSHGWVELGVNRGNAAQIFQARVGDVITVLWD